MKYYTINPEVPGGWGKNIEVDRTQYPPIVKKLHFEFEGWLGDDLVTSFPVYIGTERLKESIEQNRLTGISFDEMQTSLSKTFLEIYGNERKLPPFYWFKIVGKIGDDFYLKDGYKLNVSEKALSVLKSPYWRKHAA